MSLGIFGHFGLKVYQSHDFVMRELLKRGEIDQLDDRHPVVQAMGVYSLLLNLQAGFPSFREMGGFEDREVMLMS